MKTTQILGYNFIYGYTYQEISDLIITDIQQNNIVTNVFTPNAHGIVSYSDLPDTNKFCQQSKYILPDGQPIVWLSRFASNRIKHRLTGSDLFPVLFSKLNNTEHQLLFILSDHFLSDRFKAISNNSMCYVPPFIDLFDQKGMINEASAIFELIKNNAIKAVFLGISEPKQGVLAKLVTEIMEREKYTKGCIFLFLGASYEFYFDIKKRAPRWMQKSGLEWLYRLLKEPKRLLKRYTITNTRFIIKAIKWIFLQKSGSLKSKNKHV